ncbi:hypothetical protein AAVH_05652 [Aphelenchoides avenae]|nr:hypothetical protein AAVH_05652 [Aphelenchus avenae]
MNNILSLSPCGELVVDIARVHEPQADIDSLDRFCDTLNDEYQELLAEVQYSFVVFLMEQVYEAFDQWRGSFACSMVAPPNVRAPAVGLSVGSSSEPKSCESMNTHTSTGPTFVIRPSGNAKINVIGSQQNNTSTYAAEEAVGESRNPQTSTGPTFVIEGYATINLIGSEQNMSKETFNSIVESMNPQTPAGPTIIYNGVGVNNKCGAINMQLN